MFGVVAAERVDEGYDCVVVGLVVGIGEATTQADGDDEGSRDMAVVVVDVDDGHVNEE